jgi:hypothetical protein
MVEKLGMKMAEKMAVKKAACWVWMLVGTKADQWVCWMVERMAAWLAGLWVEWKAEYLVGQMAVKWAALLVEMSDERKAECWADPMVVK